MEDATEVGVSKEQEKFLAGRRAIIDSISSTNDESILQDEIDMGITREAETDDFDIEDHEKVVEETTVEKEEPKEEMVKIVVDGEEKEVPLSKIMDAGKRTLQKDAAADKRLEEATKLLNEAKSIKTSVKPDADKEDYKPKAMTPREIAHAIQYGTEEEAEAAISQLNTMGQSQVSLTPEKVKEIAVEAAKETSKFDEIINKFNAPKEQGGFGDIMSDPYLQKMAIESVNELLEAGEKNTWETYEKAGQNVRTWLGKYQAPVKEESGFDKKAERKKTIDNVQAAGAVTGDVKPTDKPLSAAEVIDSLAKSRPGRAG